MIHIPFCRFRWLYRSLAEARGTFPPRWSLRWRCVPAVTRGSCRHLLIRFASLPDPRRTLLCAAFGESAFKVAFEIHTSFL